MAGAWLAWMGRVLEVGRHQLLFIAIYIQKHFEILTHRVVVAEPVGMALGFLLVGDIFPLLISFDILPEPNIPHQIVLPGPHFYVFLLVVVYQVVLHHVHERDVPVDVHVTHSHSPCVAHLKEGEHKKVEVHLVVPLRVKLPLANSTPPRLGHVKLRGLARGTLGCGGGGGGVGGVGGVGGQADESGVGGQSDEGGVDGQIGT